MSTAIEKEKKQQLQHREAGKSDWEHEIVWSTNKYNEFGMGNFSSHDIFNK